MGLCRIHIRIYLCLFCALSCRRRPNSVRPTGIGGAPRRLLSAPHCARVSGQSHVAIGQNQDSGLREFQIQNEGRATRRPNLNSLKRPWQVTVLGWSCDTSPSWLARPSWVRVPKCHHQEFVHNDEWPTFEFSSIVDSADVRMIERRCSACFAPESFGGLRIM